MTISNFFEQLGAPLRNGRWSWGAADSEGRIVLRGWKDRIEGAPNDGQRIKILDGAESPRRSHPGFNERVRHLAAIREGAEGYVVVVTAKDAKTSPRAIKSFETAELLRLSGIEVIDGDHWGIIAGSVPTSDLAH